MARFASSASLQCLSKTFSKSANQGIMVDISPNHMKPAEGTHLPMSPSGYFEAKDTTDLLIKDWSPLKELLL
ncbi:hypothetical protein V6N11_018624 [Hibiscus sabdariffa]|uniref:Uncharacterized protein n=1 Tax=Hibiscus sabdariffa TaxID=183260 RepID=A0ABR2N8Q2_9ROSI